MRSEEAEGLVLRLRWSLTLLIDLGQPGTILFSRYSVDVIDSLFNLSH